MAKRARSSSAGGGRDQVGGKLRVRSFELVEAEGDVIGRLVRVGVRRFAVDFAWGGETPGSAALAALGDVAAELLGAAMVGTEPHPTRKRPAERKRRSAGPMVGGRLQRAAKADPELVVTTLGDWKRPPVTKP